MTCLYSDSMKMPLHFLGFPIFTITSHEDLGNFGMSQHKGVHVRELMGLYKNYSQHSAPPPLPCQLLRFEVFQMNLILIKCILKGY